MYLLRTASKLNVLATRLWFDLFASISEPFVGCTPCLSDEVDIVDVCFSLVMEECVLYRLIAVIRYEAPGGHRARSVSFIFFLKLLKEFKLKSRGLIGNTNV